MGLFFFLLGFWVGITELDYYYPPPFIFLDDLLAVN